MQFISARRSSFSGPKARAFAPSCVRTLLALLIVAISHHLHFLLHHHCAPTTIVGDCASPGNVRARVRALSSELQAPKSHNGCVVDLAGFEPATSRLLTEVSDLFTTV